jgi:transposase-like protein
MSEINRPKLEICHAETLTHVHGATPHAYAICTANVVVACKFCGSKNIIKFGVEKGVQLYMCKDCGRKFNEKDTPEGYRTNTARIATALGLFFGGLSYAEISRQLETIYHETVTSVTIYNWVMEYSRKAHDFMDKQKAHVSETWCVDETVINVAGKNVWYWDVIDTDTRFLIDTHLSETRTIRDVVILFEHCKKRTDVIPRFILSDGLRAYQDGIEQVFGSEANHIVVKGLTSEINNNLIERFHSTLKERYKVMRGLKRMESAWVVLNGFVFNYDFFRPHISLDNTTPAKMAGIKLPFSDWEGFIRYEATT